MYPINVGVGLGDSIQKSFYWYTFNIFFPCSPFCGHRVSVQETGLVVMTDVVSLNHRQNGGMYTDEAVPAFQPHTGTLVASMHSKIAPR